jgi:hypothetical protein
MDDPGLRRISLVTRRYGDLRGGVTRATWAPCILAIGTVEYFSVHRGLWGAIFGLLNIFSWSALGIGLWLVARKWMDRRFGLVQSDSPVLEVWIFNLWFFGYFAASFFDDHYAGGAAMPSARFLVIAAGGLWCCARVWPYSLHYLVPAVIALGFAIQFAALSSEQAIELWEIRAFGSTLLAWTAAGLIDLALLFKALPHRPEEAASVDAA